MQTHLKNHCFKKEFIAIYSKLKRLLWKWGTHPKCIREHSHIMFDWQVHLFPSILQRTQLILQLHRIHAKITRKFSSLLLTSQLILIAAEVKAVKLNHLQRSHSSPEPCFWRLKTKLLHSVQTSSGTFDVLVFPMSITSCHPVLPSTEISPWLSPNSHT